MSSALHWHEFHGVNPSEIGCAVSLLLFMNGKLCEKGDDSLKRIIASGRNVFCDNLDPLKGNPVRLVFTGENASELSPSM